MEHYIFYCKLSLLAVLSLITACCMLSRRWYVNLVASSCMPLGRDLSGLHLFFPGYMLCPAAASFIILFLSRIWDLSRTTAKGNGADPIRLPVRSGIRKVPARILLPLLQLPGLRRGRFRKDKI